MRSGEDHAKWLWQVACGLGTLPRDDADAAVAVAAGDRSRDGESRAAIRATVLLLMRQGRPGRTS